MYVAMVYRSKAINQQTFKISYLTAGKKMFSKVSHITGPMVNPVSKEKTGWKTFHAPSITSACKAKLIHAALDI